MIRSKRLYYLMEYAAIWPFVHFLRIFPYITQIKIGSFFMRAILTMRPARDRMNANLRHILPNLSNSDRANIRNGVTHTFSRTLIEILVNNSNDDHTNLYHATGPGLELILNRQDGKGFILVSGHFGAWDAPRNYLKSLGIEVGAIYRPNNNMYFDRLYLRQIRVAGQPIFSKGFRGTMEMVKHIRDGGAAAILIDQKYNKGNILDFMGHPAKTSIAAAEMALKFDVPLIPVYGIRRENSLEVDIVFEKPIPATDAVTMTQAANDSLTAMVRKYPGQWYWLHQRWETRHEKRPKVNPT